MRLLLICHEFPPIGGGGGRAAHALAECFSRDHDVTVITARAAMPPLRSGRYEVLAVGPSRRAVFGASGLEMLAFAAAAARAASRRTFDACIAVQGVPAGCVARWLAFRHGLPYVIRLVGADVPGFLPERYGRVEPIMRWVNARIWPHARAVVANSHGLKDLAVAVARPLGVDIHEVPNGVDTEFFHPSGQARREGTMVRFVFVGRLVRQKGLRELLEALHRQRARLEGRATFEIIGDGEERDQVAADIRDKGLRGLVTVTSWLPREVVVQHLQAADVFVLPSLNEGMPNALLEAMACGLPAVATSVAGNTELIQDRVNGFLVPPRDPEALGAALVEATDLGREKLATLGTESRRRSLEFSWQRSAAAYQRFLTDIAGGRLRAWPRC
jgi:glycosyltransferase involved in cell wall biosynthesis